MAARDVHKAATTLLLRRLREARDIFSALKYVGNDDSEWPVTLRISMFDTFVRIDRTLTVSPQVRHIIEALGMLAMLYRLDHGAWVTHMLEIWPEIPSEKLHASAAEGRSMEAFGVRLLAGNDRSYRDLRDCQREFRQKGQSPAYQEVLKRVHSVLRGDGDVWTPKVPVKIVMFRQTVKSLRQRASEIHELFQREGPMTIFYVSEVSSVVPSLELQARELDDLIGLRKAGLILILTRLSSCKLPPSAEYKLPLLKVLQHIFAVRTDNDGTMGVTDFTISDSTSSYWIPALLSAAHSSRSLRSLRVENRFAQLRQDHRLAWVLFAAFSRNTPLESLDLNCSDLDTRDVAPIKDFFEADDHLRLLLRRDREDATRTVGTMTASKFELVDSATEARVEYNSLQPLTVSVVSAGVDQDTMLRVLLPGYGEALVRQDNALEVSHQRTSKRERSRVGAVRLRAVSPASYQATLLLLSLILPDATRLEIEFSDDFAAALIVDWLHQFVVVSTNLAELYIKGRALNNVDPILDGYTTGALRLTKLEIENVFVGDSTGMTRFFEALGNRCHPMATQLRDLRLDVIVDSVEGAAFVDSVTSMLRHNQHLVAFKLRIRTVRGRQVLPRMFDSLRDHNRNDEMVVPLELETKLAFLSVVTTGGFVNESTGGLDENVLATIFEFSGAIHRRKVEVDVVNVLPEFVSA